MQKDEGQASGSLCPASLLVTVYLWPSITARWPAVESTTKEAAGVNQPLSTDEGPPLCLPLSLHLKCQQTSDLPGDSVSMETQTCIHKHLSEREPARALRSERSPGRLRVDSPSSWAVRIVSCVSQTTASCL